MKNDTQNVAKEIYFHKTLLVGLIQRREEDYEVSARRTIVQHLTNVWTAFLEDRSALSIDALSTCSGSCLFLEPSNTRGSLVFPGFLEMAIKYKMVEIAGSTGKEAVLNAGVRIHHFPRETLVEQIVRRTLDKQGYLPAPRNANLFTTRT